MKPLLEPESEVARCRRVREERDRRFGTLEAALRHFDSLERAGSRPARKHRSRPTLAAKKHARSA